MDFLADENVPRPIIERLRTDGFTVRAVFEESTGIADVRVLTLADEGGLILITQDQDFGELAVLRQAPVACCASWLDCRLRRKSSVSQVFLQQVRQTW